VGSVRASSSYITPGTHRRGARGEANQLGRQLRPSV